MRHLSLPAVAILAAVQVSAAPQVAPPDGAPELRRWTEQGFSPADAETWTRVGIDPAEAREWVQAGVPYAEWANQFKGEGFGPADAGVWVEHEINVYTAGDFRAAGFSVGEATAWIARGVRSARRAQEFRDREFGPAEAGGWWALGFSADDAARWRNHGFQAVGAQTWKYGETEYFYMRDGSRNSARTVYDVEWAREWHAAGFSPDEARLAVSYDVSLAEASAWLAAGFAFPEAMAWRDSAFDPAGAAIEKAEGLSPVEAQDRRRAGLPQPTDVITAWHSDIVLRSDATLEVTETIAVLNRPGGPIDRCFTRALPATVALRRSAASYTTAWPSYDVTSVLQDGAPVPYSIDRDRAGDLTLCVGGDAPVPAGGRTFTLQYTTDDRLIDLHNHDRLFFDVVGPELTAHLPIRRASAAVRLPTGANTVRADGFAGLPKRKYFTAEISETVIGDVVHYAVTRPLERDMGFAVAISLPKGFAQASLWRQVRRLDRAEGRILSSVFVLAFGQLAALLYFLWAWHRVGRDPRKGAVVPVYEPPDGISPALMRYLVARRRVDDRTVAATLVRMAHCGALVIQEREGLYRIQRNSQAAHGCAAHEAAFVARLFAGGDVLILGTRATRRALRAARKVLRANLRAERAMLVQANTRRLRPGLVLSCAGAAVALAVVSLPDQAAYGYALFVTAVVAALNFTFWRLLKAPTPAGHQVFQAVEGFRQFLQAAYGAAAAGHDMPSMNAVAVRAEYLPYAIALGADSDRASILDRRNAWYTGNSGGFSVADFTASLQRMMPRAVPS